MNLWEGDFDLFQGYKYRFLGFWEIVFGLFWDDWRIVLSLKSSLSGKLSESDYLVDPFYVSENSLQMRYRYEISPLSYFYLVYTRGYSFYDDSDTFTYEDLYQDSWENPSNEVFTLKVRFKF